MSCQLAAQTRKLRIRRSVVARHGCLLFSGALFRREREDLANGVRQAFKGNSALRGAYRDPELADIVVLAREALIEGKCQHGPAWKTDRLSGFKDRPVGCAEGGGDSPAGARIAVDGAGDRKAFL